MAGLDFLNREVCVSIGVILLVVLALYIYKTKFSEGFDDDGVLQSPQLDDTSNPAMPPDVSTDALANAMSAQTTDETAAAQLAVAQQNTNVLPYPQYSNNYGPEAGSSAAKLDCFPKDTVTPRELMPREDPYNTWSAAAPPTEGHLMDRNYLESGHHYGINTQGSSLRNANLQIRSDPPIPQVNVSLWNQSTISPDTNRRALEIGGDF